MSCGLCVIRCVWMIDCAIQTMCVIRLFLRVCVCARCHVCVCAHVCVSLCDVLLCFVTCSLSFHIGGVAMMLA